MNFIENVFAKLGFISREKAEYPSVFSTKGADPFAIWKRASGKVSAKAAINAYTGWVYAAIKAISVEIGGMEFRLFRVGKETDTEIYEHELLDILEAPNEYQTGLELRQQLTAHLSSTGNAYLYLEGVNSPTKKPIAIHIMDPGNVTVVVDRNKFPSQITGYKYQVGTSVYTFLPQEIIHFRDPDPVDSFEGVGVVQSIAQWVDADNYAMEFNRRFFLNGAHPGGFLESTEALTPDQLTYIKASFEAAHRGTENAYKVMALPKGMKFTEGGKTQKDLDFNNLMQMMGNRIIGGFRVPRTVLGITDDVNRANAEATDYVFAARVVKPMMKLVLNYLNNFLAPRYGKDIYLDFKDPVPEDRRQSMEEMRASTGGAAVLTINEARERYFGLDPIDGGDVVPARINPVGQTGEMKNIKGGSKMKVKKKVLRTRYAMNVSRREEVRDAIGEAIEKATKKAFKEARNAVKKGITELTDEEFESVWKGFALRVDGYEKKYIKKIREFNAIQQKEVLRNLSKATRAIDKKKLFDFDKSFALFVDITTPLFYELAEKEGKEAALLIGQVQTGLSADMSKALDKSISLLSDSYNSTTLDLLKEKLEQGIKEGYDQQQLANVVKDIYDFSDSSRALTVARTETFRVANYSTQEAWKQSGIVKSQRWYTATDERVCPYCSPLHNKTIGIEESFFKEGDELQGTDGSTFKVDYSDVDAPPIHPNCRCYLRPESISLE